MDVCHDPYYNWIDPSIHPSIHRPIGNWQRAPNKFVVFSVSCVCEMCVCVCVCVYRRQEGGEQLLIMSHLVVSYIICTVDGQQTSKQCAPKIYWRIRLLHQQWLEPSSKPTATNEAMRVNGSIYPLIAMNSWMSSNGDDGEITKRSKHTQICAFIPIRF